MVVHDCPGPHLRVVEEGHAEPEDADDPDDPMTKLVLLMTLSISSLPHAPHFISISRLPVRMNSSTLPQFTHLNS
jgi:hypothetical protein